MEIDTKPLGDRSVVLRLDGRLNMVAAPRLKTAVESAVDGGAPRVVVDLSDVAFMDSSGLGALIAALKRTRQAQGDLRIAGVNAQVATVLKLTNLDRVLRPFPTVEAATDGW
ncbi:STAS domain-containing protein [Nocardioides mesophilus]|uniref:Anti-sigma factor antagonist n=1 Tax=Nocardioides mesophilus TaxID=433659 RepID=A0A7G9RBM5_9ACTN|nr:STAS domain-containing protein [Nocardioides mesophilus]QNN53000.1 STAS domain-containing protein [Nocardioides mesophilus]